MQTPIIVIDGQELPIDAATAETDEGIRQALRGFYPDITNATITRRTENDRLIITIVKRAGTKGATEKSSVTPGAFIRRKVKARQAKFHAHENKAEGNRFGSVLGVLKAAPEELNPAVKLAYELQTAIATGEMTHAGVALRRREIEEAVLGGEREARQVTAALDSFKGAPAVSSSQIPTGF
ncbi:MAG: hypothetical protein MSG64_20690 [Pyrinomonadaceae bacterium MAG19_C2-C3]|nr:hypothetical protein [Pyrinomonadaceae bacterium MAG19_C2-C3]